MDGKNSPMFLFHGTLTDIKRRRHMRYGERYHSRGGGCNTLELAARDVSGANRLRPPMCRNRFFFCLVNPLLTALFFFFCVSLPRQPPFDGIIFSYHRRRRITAIFYAFTWFGIVEFPYLPSPVPWPSRSPTCLCYAAVFFY